VIRRGLRTGDVPPELLHYRVQDWPSCAAWDAARREWMAEHRPASLDDLNAFYCGPDVVLAPMADPREV
jgi:hypothetical protein